MKNRITAYLRDQGPVCYETKILNLDDKQALRSWASRLLSMDIGWYWESRRSRPMADDSQYHYLPEQRSLTLLTINNMEIFLDDLSERDIDGYARFVAIFGTDSDADLLASHGTQFGSALERFSEFEEAPIRVVVVQIGDSPCEYIFVPHNLIEQVRCLIENWGITPSAITKKRAYKYLYTAKLESLLEPIQAISVQGKK